MNNYFTLAMKFISKWEWRDQPDGAYTDDPNDPGGETKYGISKRANPTLNIADLSLATALDCYYKEYWIAFGLDSLAFPFSVAALDTYVQHRPNVAAKLLKDAEGSVQKLLEARRVFYLNLVGKNASLLKFKNGWLARLRDLGIYCSMLSQEDLLARPPSATPSPSSPSP